MNEVIKYLNAFLPQAAKAADIDVDPIRGFDGDGWVWIWRKYIGEVPNVCGVEAIFRAQPDTFYERVSTEVLAHTWKEKVRDVSWSMTYGVEVLLVSDFKAQAESHLKPGLSNRLSAAWSDAKQQAERLDDLEGRRNKLQAELRDTNLMGG